MSSANDRDRDHDLEPGLITVTWSESRQIQWGYRPCAMCKSVRTPKPSMEQMVEHCKDDGGRYLWPGHGRGCFIPDGWTAAPVLDMRLICPACTQAVSDLVESRRKK